MSLPPKRKPVKSGIELETMVEIDPARGCWVWTGPRDERGYGRIKRQGQSRRIHRLFYEKHKGPIPRGALLMHSCDRPECVNPDHLTPGTKSENFKDMWQKGRAAPTQGLHNGRARLTPAQVTIIRDDPRGDRTIARIFGISRSNVGRIRRLETWGNS